MTTRLPQRHRYEVLPTGCVTAAPTKRWRVTRDAITIGLHSRKVDAVAQGADAAKRSWRHFGELGSLLIKGRNGRIQDERTYGRDPIKTKG